MVGTSLQIDLTPSPLLEGEGSRKREERSPSLKYFPIFEIKRCRIPPGSTESPRSAGGLGVSPKYKNPPFLCQGKGFTLKGILPEGIKRIGSCLNR
jgi:hypothetical protein